MSTVTFKIEKARGYSGNRSAKSYIAKIVGTDKKYIFNREFADTEAVDPGEAFAARRRGKGTWIEAAALESGLYEISRYGERSYMYVWQNDAGEAKWTKATEDRAAAMALLMDEGQSFAEARLATKPPTTVPNPE